MYDSFSPDNVSEENMKNLADHIEAYLDQLESVMIIPDDIMEEYGKEIDEGIRLTRKLIKKLRKGDKSVFKELDEDNPTC